MQSSDIKELLYLQSLLRDVGMDAHADKPEALAALLKWKDAATSDNGTVSGTVSVTAPVKAAKAPARSAGRGKAKVVEPEPEPPDDTDDDEPDF